jgi:4-amino-4-deoxy-L-arabinose transferase-like glycosyltransferase
LIPFVVFSLFRTKMQAYTVFAAPALFLLTAVFFYYLKSIARKLKPRWVAAACLILLIGRPVRYSIDRLRVFRSQERSPGWVSILAAANPCNQGPATVSATVYECLSR